MSEQPSRYQRSMSGLVGAMLVTLLAVTAFVAWRAINRDDLEVEPEPVDYLDSVQAVQASGTSVVYPPDLPAGWFATSADYRPGPDLSWAVGTLTAGEAFVGFREEAASVEQLVEDYVDEGATEGDAVRLDSRVSASWRSFTDADGDYALATEGDGTAVLVYGNAEPDEIEALAELLTREQLPSPGAGQSS